MKHSQSSEAPHCGANQIKLWNGYSLIYVDGHNYASYQDLGSSGSCVPKFSTVLAASCGKNYPCTYVPRNDSTFWLTTAEITTNTPVKKEIERYISRCVVCEVLSIVITRHSQSSDVPPCPNGWDSLWNGFSFLTVNSTILIE